MDEWFRCFAINHAVGNWDSVGYKNAQNTYAYKPYGALLAIGVQLLLSGVQQFMVPHRG